jgi:uncharacterized protein
MASSFVVNLIHSIDDPDRATVGMVVANAAVASGLETVVFLSTEGVRLGVKGGGDRIAEAGFKPMKELLTSFLEAGGKIWVCSPCFKKRNLPEDELLPNTTIVGGAKLVEFITNGAGSVTY